MMCIKKTAAAWSGAAVEMDFQNITGGVVAADPWEQYGSARM